MTIYKINPYIKNAIWAGKKLKKFYNKISDVDEIAESWELSANENGLSQINSIDFDKFVRDNPQFLGKNYDFEKFPLLIKYIDADDDLSVQVHPTDEYARKNGEPYGKNEIWYVVNHDPKASLYVGMKENVTREQLEKAIDDADVLKLLNKIEVENYDSVFIPAGTIHAIGKGITVIEVQQNSDTTYRLYDYDRVDKYGNHRELHKEKSLEVSDLNRYDFDNLKHDAKKISNEYFHIEILDLNGDLDVEIDEDSFRFLGVFEGNCTVGELEAQKGDSFFIPASNDCVKIKGYGKIIIVKLGAI